MDLSILIPARNEMFLNQTIASILESMEADTEVIVALDGSWPIEPIPQHERVTVIKFGESIGQRAATNQACRLSDAKYVMKLDAHCRVGRGFDRIMIEDMRSDWTMVPKMYNLHAFDWVCKECGWRRYQSPTPDACPECGGPVERKVLWREKHNPCSTSMRFNSDLKFKYWRAYKKQQRQNPIEGDSELVETMSLLGACWMLERERYWDLNICDEGHGGWGQQGTEVACKTWLSGGRLVCTQKTWFAHMFRTQGGDFGFPYPLSGGAVRRARNYSKELWMPNGPNELPAWDKAVHTVAWLVNKFGDVPGWEDEEIDDGSVLPEIDQPSDTEPMGTMEPELSKAILYYTDNRLDERIMTACQRQIEKAGLPIFVVSLKPMNWGDHNIVINAERGPLTLHRQILAGLEAMDAEVVFFAEHDVLYHPSHWEFIPETNDNFWYNTNVWKVRLEDGHAVWTDRLRQTSGLCAHRSLLLEQYRRRVREIEEDGWDRHYEPCHKTGPWTADYWQSAYPNLDIRHGQNATVDKWSPEDFRNPKYAQGWAEADAVEPWYKEGGFEELLDRLEGE